MATTPTVSIRAGFAPAVVLAIAVVATPGAAEQHATDTAQPPPTLQDAIGRLQAQEWAEAAGILEAIVTKTPETPRAWAMLGRAYHQQERWDDAMGAWLRAADFPQTKPNALYGIAQVHARQGRKDDAFAWLEKARASRQVDMTRILGDAELGALRDDPRFRKLLPNFDDLFVESTRVLQEWDGESAGDQFGWIARNIGDVDGDSVADLTTSAPTRDVDGANAGRVYTYSGKTGKLLWTRDGEPGDQLGLGIEAAGDVNADGVPDVIAGAPGSDRAFVFSGKDGETVLSLAGKKKGEFFGRKPSDLGDFDGDGHDDVIVGAPRNDKLGANTGRAAVYSGSDGRILWERYGERAGDAYGSGAAGFAEGKQKLIAIGAPNAGENNGGRTYVYARRGKKARFVIEADATGNALGGMFISIIGDVDADGALDVYASDWSNNASGRSTGRIYVHSGKSGKRLMTLTGEAAGDGFGIGPADAGDVDGDGHDDLVVGAWQQGNGAPAGGKTYLFSGKDGTLLREWTCKVDGDTFGFDATGMGDVDGDGAIDFLVTSAWSGVEGYRSGRVFILAGDKSYGRPRR